MKDLFGNQSMINNRATFDFYPTPAWMVRSLVHYAPEIAGASIFECASGDNAITDVLRDEYGCKVTTNDIDPSHPSMLHGDATLEATWKELLFACGGDRHEWVITNPPFNCAFLMLQQHRRRRLGFRPRACPARPLRVFTDLAAITSAPWPSRFAS